MTGTRIMTWDDRRGVMVVLVWPPMACPGCGVPSCLLVNDEGKTICASRCYGAKKGVNTMESVLEKVFTTHREQEALLMVELVDGGFQVLWNIRFLQHAASCPICADLINQVLERIKTSLDDMRPSFLAPEGKRTC